MKPDIQRLIKAACFLAALASCTPAHAQQIYPPPLSRSGAVTVGHCAAWNSNYQLKDAGACGGGGVSAAYFATSLSATQLLISGSTTKVAFDTVTFDSAGYYNTTNRRYTPLVAGTYRIHAFVQGEATYVSTVQWTIYIYKNGSQLFLNNLYQPSTLSGSFSSMGVDALVAFNGTTDYVEIFANLAGTSPEIFGGGTQYGTFEGNYIAP